MLNGGLFQAAGPVMLPARLALAPHAAHLLPALLQPQYVETGNGEKYILRIYNNGNNTEKVGQAVARWNGGADAACCWAISG